MKHDDEAKMHFATRAIHAGQEPDQAFIHEASVVKHNATNGRPIGRWADLTEFSSYAKGLPAACLQGF